jgi:putative ABC transport system substrate-binding protein
MERRTFLRVITGGLLAAPRAVEAQPARKVVRIGYLGYSSPALEQHLVEALRQGLRELGYVESQNLVIEYRSAGGNRQRFPELVADLVGLKVDVIVTLATPAALAARQATTTIPIVVAAMADPVQDGLVASLARPGGNITGSTFLGPRLVPKRLELLKEVSPKAFRVALLWHPGIYSERTMKEMLQETVVAARSLGMQTQLVGATSPADFAKAFSAMSRVRADALVVFPSPMLYLEYKSIVDLVAQNRLPAVYPWREAVDAGGLIAYGANIPDMLRHAAAVVDRVLKGAKPADLPIEQPTTYELVINLKTAKTPVLQRADQVIE